MELIKLNLLRFEIFRNAVLVFVNEQGSQRNPDSIKAEGLQNHTTYFICNT